MTKPTVIFFGPDISVESKVFIRTLLYSTSDRGQYIENMYLRLSRKSWSQDFNVWVYGEPANLARGSGLFVGKHGLATNHHFLLPKDGSSFKVKSGDYKLEVYAELVGRRPRRIYHQDLVVTQPQAKELLEKDAGIYFDWAPNIQTYQSHIDRKPQDAALSRIAKQFEND
jgi:hypothetical protein